MKRRTIVITICLLGAMLLAGCSKEAAPASQPQAEEEEAVEALPEEEPDKPKKSPVSKMKKEKTEEAAPGEETDAGREEAFRQILYKYKEAQDMKYSMEEVGSMGLNTELVQHGWPSGVIAGDVKYLYYDVDSDGSDELIITYYDEIIDIYGYDGKQAVLAFSTPYRGIAELHPDGMLMLVFSYSASDGYTSWYEFDPGFGNFFQVFECRYDDGRESYFTFCAYNMSDEERSLAERSYRDYGTYPVWMFEWSDELTKDEYEKLKPDTEPVSLPDGELLADVVLPDDYEYAKIPDAASSGFGATVEVTKDMQKKLNTFLSNFAEQDMQYYDSGRPDVSDIIHFAYMWTYINRHSDIKVEDGQYYVLSLNKIRQVVEKYMEYPLSNADIDPVSWPDKYGGSVKDGNYRIPAADGESYNTLAVVTALTDEGSGLYRAEFTVYDLDWDYFINNESVDSVPKEFYSYSGSEAASEPNLVKSGNGYAIIRKDGDSYKLRYYELYK